MKKVSILNIIIGSVILGTVIFKNIEGEKGFALFSIAIILILSGILINKKLREILINFILIFFENIFDDNEGKK
ncbi:MAG: hypothetical protein SOV85_13180 [Clostridium sp.]|uniref:hypothetical protein n=2 Tax=Clostridium sp. TaxID=1506 RepID=UPI002A760997|nr:hypothetical protein [Clostridium sp.]MDY2632288.1 hypothetical protein [Clostridium sp.]